MTDPGDVVRLRRARRADRSPIRRMVRRARLNPLGLAWERFTVAVNATDDVVGCVQLKPHRDGSQELASLVVVEAWRGRGIARELIADVKTRSDGLLWLMCEESLASFYERFGFHGVTDSSHMPFYFRLIWRLARLASILTGGYTRLAVMRWRRQSGINAP